MFGLQHGAQLARRQAHILRPEVYRLARTKLRERDRRGDGQIRLDPQQQLRAGNGSYGAVYHVHRGYDRHASVLGSEVQRGSDVEGEFKSGVHRRHVSRSGYSTHFMWTWMWFLCAGACITVSPARKPWYPGPGKVRDACSGVNCFVLTSHACKVSISD